MAAFLNAQKGTWVLLSFIAFFGVIIAVNAVFIKTALDTHSGVVTEQPYEKGLAFNDVLEKAKAQPDIEHDVSFKDGVLQLHLPVSGAQVQASFFRPVKEGQDFEVVLREQKEGVYITTPNMPLPGSWTVRLKVTWDNQVFQTAHDFIAE